MKETWGGKTYTAGGRNHHLLVRPFPLLLQPHPEDYILMLCRFPDAGMDNITEAYVHGPALRRRLALYDLQRAEKINLTRSEVFVYFERYLRRAHSLRIGPAPALSRSLEEGGILSLQMG